MSNVASQPGFKDQADQTAKILDARVAIDNLTAIMTTTDSNITAADSALTSATSSSSTISGAGGGTVTGGGSATATRPPNP